jgi:hypothetical protein
MVATQSAARFDAPTFEIGALFDASRRGAEGEVVRVGKLFEAGEYPDKKIAFDEDDLERAVQSFQPVANDLEHEETILDGRLGWLRRVWRQGRELFGEVSIPKWLDEIVGGRPIGVSLAFDREKRIVGNALVLQPRIRDAAIIRAFSAKQPETAGKMTLRDAIKRLFGVQNPEELDAEVNLPDEFQSQSGDANAQAAPASQAPAHDAAQTSRPFQPAPAFSRGDGDGADVDAMRRRIAALEAQNAAMQAQALSESAYRFADEQISARRAVPAQREQIARLYAGAVRADANGGAMFSADGAVAEGELVGTLRELFANAPESPMTVEAFAGASVLMSGEGDGPDPRTIERYLEMTPLGRQVLQERRNAANGAAQAR